MPASQEWLTFAEWGEKWGDIITVSILGKRIIILNSAQAAFDMLDKKSSIYSGRPELHMCELCGWNNLIIMMQPDQERFRNTRKHIHQAVGTSMAMKNFHAVEEEETRKFVKRTLSDPEGLFENVRRTAGAIILRIAYGYHVAEKDDLLVAIADDVLGYFSAGTAPGGFWVNVIPALKYIPEWFPGGGFKRIASGWRARTEEMADRPLQFVKENMTLKVAKEKGTAEPSFSSRLLSENVERTKQEEEDIKWSATALYGAGSDTTVATVNAFFLAMILFPETMRKAQHELDSVVGRDRLPAFSDRDNLPYTNAVALEALRWHAVSPTCMPHTLVSDDIHEGYFIPGGSIIIPNIWKMLHDERVYKDPFQFNPDRFLGLNPEPNPTNVCFGFGRRICPGRILAEASVFITCAMTLSTCNIEKPKKIGLQDKEPIYEQTTGTVRKWPWLRRVSVAIQNHSNAHSRLGNLGFGTFWARVK
ncbi:cytochrome P450 [Panaeolus papilionaceus]|nr:cytochrome P450 [Panaeolus papilionaceus]